MRDTVETAQHFIYVTQVYFCYAVVVWDWIISLPREWRFIWKTSWTPVKLAYLFCRRVHYWVIAVVPYLLFAFVTNHTQEVCEKIYKIPVALAMWNQVGSESVLLIRTYAFFNRNVYLLVGLICALAGVVAYQLYVDASQMMLLPFVTPPYVSSFQPALVDALTPRNHGQGPCFPVSKPHSAHLLGFFIAPLLFDTLVTAMTVWKAFHIRMGNGGPSSKLIQTFLREGSVFYYILISIANLINGIFYLQPRQVISALNIPLSVMMAPLLACRLILDLKERGAETVCHFEGTGIGAFATKSGVTSSSDGTLRRKRGGLGVRHRGPGSTIASNIMLTTIGSIQPDLEAPEVELDELHFESAMGPAGDSSRTLGFVERKNLAPDYNASEVEFATRCRKSDVSEVDGVSGIRIDIEKTTTSM
ncbi:hypothetical protein BU15DRAFT_40889 [Melanogaster broomeanus]|nr:hypothetical protein BU15DRAFT_40889 [Melanogaster broomeanus]